MAQDVFRIYRGLEIDESAQILTGAGAPVSADATAAPTGSLYLDSTAGGGFLKTTIGSNWMQIATQNWVNNLVATQVSWREPARVADTSSTTLPTNTTQVDGVTLADGDRVLFTALTSGSGPNVYIYQASTKTFVDDINEQTKGDTIYVDEGSTTGGMRFTYNGTAWVRFDTMTLDELSYIRSFIGKTAAGSSSPVYGSVLTITQGSNHTAAISSLDLAIGANVSTGNFITPTNKINGNIQALDSEIGPQISVGNFISGANKINGNIQILDASLGANVTNGNYISPLSKINGNIQALDSSLGGNVSNGNFVTASNKINANIQALDTALGSNVASGTYILSTNKVNTNIQALDTALAAVSKEFVAANLTAATTLDSVNTTLAKWVVRVVDTVTPANVYATEIIGTHNGVTADMVRYATLKLGNTITGLSINVNLSGSNLQLVVQSTTAVNVIARRVTTF